MFLGLRPRPGVGVSQLALVSIIQASWEKARGAEGKQNAELAISPHRPGLFRPLIPLSLRGGQQGQEMLMA